MSGFKDLKVWQRSKELAGTIIQTYTKWLITLFRNAGE